MQKGIHSDSHDPKDKENLSKVDELILKLYQEMQEYEDARNSISLESIAKKQQIKNKSDDTVPPPPSLVNLHEMAISTVKGRKKVFASLTAFPPVTNVDDEDCKKPAAENKKLKSDTNALGDEGGSLRQIMNQTLMGVAGNDSTEWGSYLELKKEEVHSTNSISKALSLLLSLLKSVRLFLQHSPHRWVSFGHYFVIPWWFFYEITQIGELMYVYKIYIMLLLLLLVSSVNLIL